MSNQALDTCEKTFTSDSSSGPSHLETNMDSLPFHPNQDTCDFCVCSETNIPSENPGLKLDKLRRALCEFVVAGGHPFGIIEEPGLKKMMCALCPSFSFITKQALFKDALAYHKEEKLIVESELLNAPGRICFTLDNWRNEQTGDEYMRITACWVDHSWRLQKIIIRFLALTSPFDGASLAEEILLSLGQWKVADKVFSFILDDADAPYSDSLVASLRSNLERKQALVLNGEFLHMRSYSHIINLLGKASLKLLDDVLAKIRNTVIHLRNSTSKQEKFYEAAQTSFGLNTTERLRLDTFTTWDSTFLMLDRFLYYREVIVNFVSNDMDIQVFCLTQEEWAKVDELHKFLKAIYTLTSGLSTSKKPTTNTYFYVVWRIHKKLVDICNGPPSILSAMVKGMPPEFEKYWSDFRLSLSCAAVLDPRFNLEGVEYCYKALYGKDRAKEMLVTVKNTLFHLFDEYKQTSTATSPRVGTSNVGESEDDWLESLFDEDDFAEYKARKKIEKSEMEYYLKWPTLYIKKDLDLLEFWKSDFGNYTVLSTMARDILTVPLSVAPLESGFGTGEKLIAPCRSSLLPKTIEALTCYKDWLRAKGLSSGPCGLDALVEIEEDGDEANIVGGPCSMVSRMFNA